MLANLQNPVKLSASRHDLFVHVCVFIFMALQNKQVVRLLSPFMSFLWGAFNV